MIFSRLIKFVAAGLLAPAAFLALASMPAGASPKVTVLAFGLFGAQSVFESEAKGAASIIAQRLSTGPVVVRANTKTRGDVTIASFGNILQSTAERMDRESDILFLILTSHGSQEGVAVEAGRHSEILSPADLADMLNRGGAAPYRGYFGMLFRRFRPSTRE